VKVIERSAMTSVTQPNDEVCYCYSVVASKILEAPMNSWRTPPTSLIRSIPYIAPGKLFGSLFGIGVALFLSSQLALAQFRQQSELGAAGAIGAAGFGVSVALSADGNTALVGGPGDNGRVGAVWAFTRSGSVWTQQGGKLTANDTIGAAEFGNAVALSADGNTAIVGGPRDNGGAGAVWAFTRNENVWSQQAKLTSNDENGGGAVGATIALSADGNTAIVRGPAPNTYRGSMFFFTRSGGSWTQQGPRIPAAPLSVAIAADGNTALMGDSDTTGAWIYTRRNGVWSRQPPELIGNNTNYTFGLGTAVALSGDANTALVGGIGDNNYIGAAWAFARSRGGGWTQQKLSGTGAEPQTPSTYGSQQGFSAALSADGNTAIVGGPDDSAMTGATWAYTRNVHGVWSQLGGKLFSSTAPRPSLQGSAVALSADGNTAIIGGPGNAISVYGPGNTNSTLVGAAWVYTRGPCQPLTCASAGWSCGSLDNGCGAQLQCGSCGAGLSCTVGSCFRRCAATHDCPSPQFWSPETCSCVRCPCGTGMFKGKPICDACRPTTPPSSTGRLHQ
jgi:hypothetical protein